MRCYEINYELRRTADKIPAPIANRTNAQIASLGNCNIPNACNKRTIARTTNKEPAIYKKVVTARLGRRLTSKTPHYLQQIVIYIVAQVF